MDYLDVVFQLLAEGTYTADFLHLGRTRTLGIATPCIMDMARLLLQSSCAHCRYPANACQYPLLPCLVSVSRARRQNASRLFGAYASNLFVVSKARLDQRSAAFWRLVSETRQRRACFFASAD